MKTAAWPMAFLTLTLAAGTATLLAGPAGATDAGTPPAAPAAGTAPLPLEDILAAARAVRPGRILEAELDDDGAGHRPVWEVEIRDADGAIWELYLDPASGAVLKTERG